MDKISVGVIVGLRISLVRVASIKVSKAVCVL
jgi:hypothetical protein